MHEGKLIWDGGVLISPDEMRRLFILRGKLFKQILIANEESEGHHKSYEGRLDITMSLPNIWEDEDDSKPEWCIHLACYLLGTHGRGEDWYGNTFTDCLDKFEKWLEPYDSLRPTKIEEETK